MCVLHAFANDIVAARIVPFQGDDDWRSHCKILA